VSAVTGLLKNGAVYVALVFSLPLFLTVSLGARLIPLMQRWSFGQYAYEDAPETHAVKTGTPTMGGLLFLIVLIALAIVTRGEPHVLALIGLGLGCGVVGLVDDYLSVRRATNRGLRARTKLLLTAIVGAVFLWFLSSLRYGVIYGVVVPFHGVLAMPHWLWFAVSLLAIVATTHAVNLTDGLDGLASGTILPVFAVLIWFGVFWPSYIWWDTGAVVAMVDIAVAGAVIGFLFYNRFPAKLIMGDTGSLALGGILAGSAIMLGLQLMLIVIGGVFVAETLSVILQVASFKMTGKRIFRMSPLHHHFELAGWPETKVTHRFWAASALCSLLGVALLKFGAVR